MGLIHLTKPPRFDTESLFYSTLYSSKTQNLPSQEQRFHWQLSVFTGLCWEDTLLPCPMSPVLLCSDSIDSVKSKETMTLGSLESVQQDIKNKKLDEVLVKLSISKGNLPIRWGPVFPQHFFMWISNERKFSRRTEEMHRHDVLIISDNWRMRSTVLVHVVGCNCTSTSALDDKQKSGAKIYCGWQLRVRKNFWHLWAQKLMWRQMTYQRLACFAALTSHFFPMLMMQPN